MTVIGVNESFLCTGIYRDIQGYTIIMEEREQRTVLFLYSYVVVL